MLTFTYYYLQISDVSPCVQGAVVNMTAGEVASAEKSREYLPWWQQHHWLLLSIRYSSWWQQHHWLLLSIRYCSWWQHHWLLLSIRYCSWWQHHWLLLSISYFSWWQHHWLLLSIRWYSNLFDFRLVFPTRCCQGWCVFAGS